MCGICGMIEKTEPENGADFIKKMSDLIFHRGPDSAGFHLEPPVYFGHRRLSIIDLNSSAGQPLQNNHCVLIFNGEIYNYHELRQELTEYPFCTQGDTEVILAAWQRWGESCVEHLRGMWAFALYDKKKNCVFCSRDRFGIKPFYYFEQSEYFAFASEIKQFTCLPGWKATANHNRLLDFLLLELMDHTSETMFQGVSQLLPGHNLTYDLAQHTYNLSRYYDVDKASQSLFSGDYSEACHSFFKIAEESIWEHLQADVSVGSCLSGGLDSSTIVSLVHRQLIGKNDSRQLTVSACSPDPKTDEQEYMDEIIHHLHLESHKVWPKADELLKCIERITWHQDEPFPSTSIFAQWKVFEEASVQGSKVMLDGQGADEILAGYSGVYGIFLAELVRKGKLKTLTAEIQTLHSDCGFSLHQLAILIIAELMPRRLKGWIRGQNRSGLAGFVYVDKAYRKANVAPLYKNQMKTMREYAVWMLQTTSLPKLLHFEDRDSMAFSVEARVPFLDHRLVETALEMPTRYKVHDGYTKRVLRDAMTGILPEKIKNRRSKLGFETPESLWIRENPEVFRQLYEAGLKALGSLVDTNRALQWYARETRIGQNVDRGVWRIISIGIWAKVFDVKI